jgi:diamine N-acetyltransferase
MNIKPHIQSGRILIRPLKRDDIDKRLKWKKYRDPLYFHYNLPEMTISQKRQWYLKRKNDPASIYLAIESIRGKLLGFINLYNINMEKKMATLGIYLGSEFTDKGYGTEAIMILLPHYFETIGFKELRLEVASHNKRAIECYRKCGFKPVKTAFHKHDPRNKLDIFGDERFKSVRKYFKKNKDKILVQFKIMKITRKMFEVQSGLRHQLKTVGRIR